MLREAVELADADGLEAVSMRRLAQRLGVVPMALYKHVADKEELLDAMVDLLIAEYAAPEDEADDAGAEAVAQDWRQAVRARLLAARRAVTRHPWARRAIESRTRRTPAVLGHMDAVAGTLLAGGLSADLTHHVMHALGNRIWGFSPEMFDESRADAEAPAPAEEVPQAEPGEAAREFTARFPHIVQIARAAGGGGSGCDEDFEFAFALDLLLDGAERLHRGGWRSGDRPG